MKNRGVLQWTALALSVLMAAGVQTVFRACAQKEDGTWMHCHEVQKYLFIIGIILAMLSVLGLAVKKRTAAILLDFASIVLAAAAVLLPGTVMQMCMMDTMRCYTMMQPFARVTGGVLILVSVIDIIKLFRTA
jgi:hypothetical protein